MENNKEIGLKVINNVSVQSTIAQSKLHDPI